MAHYRYVAILSCALRTDEIDYPGRYTGPRILHTVSYRPAIRNGMSGQKYIPETLRDCKFIVSDSSKNGQGF
jgi:hypothetical protein